MYLYYYTARFVELVQVHQSTVGICLVQLPHPSSTCSWTSLHWLFMSYSIRFTASLHFLSWEMQRALSLLIVSLTCLTSFGIVMCTRECYRHVRFFLVASIQPGHNKRTYVYMPNASRSLPLFGNETDLGSFEKYGQKNGSVNNWIKTSLHPLLMYKKRNTSKDTEQSARQESAVRLILGLCNFGHVSYYLVQCNVCTIHRHFFKYAFNC